MKTLIAILLLIPLVAGCASNDLTPEQQHELAKATLVGRLMPGSDSTCYGIGLTYCRDRTRTVTDPDGDLMQALLDYLLDDDGTDDAPEIEN